MVSSNIYIETILGFITLMSFYPKTLEDKDG